MSAKLLSYSLTAAVTLLFGAAFTPAQAAQTRKPAAKSKSKKAPEVQPDEVQDPVPTEAPPQGVTEPETHESDVKRWFLQGTIGGSFTNRDDQSQAAIKQINAVPGVHRIPLTIEIGGYGNFINDKTLFGIVINSITNQYSVSGYSDTLSIDEFLMALSVKQYFMNANTGPFVRADFGMSFVHISESGSSVVTSNVGWGAGAQAGYSLDFGWKVQPELSVGYTYRRNGRDGTSSFHDGAIQILAGVSFGL